MIGQIFVFILIGIGGALGIWLIIFIIKKIYKVLLGIIAAILIFLAIGFVFSVMSKIKNKGNNEIVANDTTSNQQDNEFDDSDESGDKVFIPNSFNWSDYSNKKFSIDYKIAESDFIEAQANRSQYFGDTWHDIYQNLYENDRKMLSSVYQKFDSLQQGHDALDFARLIVSSVQEIPYTWILVEGCNDAPNFSEIQSSGYKCIGNIKNYAVLSPAEFLVSQKGDCDTKSMVLYTILKRFNYDVRILISEQYAHAMLGINIPASGIYLNYQGEKYYVWETTVEGMDVGLISPDYSNLSFWEVAL
jgi:hypothetical protein